jgi:sigma-B regulation protein RsbU (phosphoserine phosphatase)
MAITHGIAHAIAEPPARPGAFLTHLNRTLSARFTRTAGAFVTAFYAVFDPARGTLTYASAGHNPPRLLRCLDGSLVPLNRAQRLPLGVSPADAEYAEAGIELVPGDQVVLFTDGVTEAVNKAGDVFGTERLDAVLASCPRRAEDLLRGMLAELEAFTKSAAPTDDRTLVVARRTS